MNDHQILEAVVAVSEQKINRVEVIDDQGRSYVHHKGKPLTVDLSIQDNGQTLKIFVNSRNDHA